MVKTKNFNPITDPKLACTCGHSECDKRVVRQWVLDRIQLMRDDLRKPMIITSGGRCPNHPNEVGRGDDTDHKLCTTVDIECDNDMLATKLKVLAGRHGATRVAGEAEDGFIHVSWTETDRTDVPTWEY